LLYSAGLALTWPTPFLPKEHATYILGVKPFLPKTCGHV
jgi:hypothetical protein